MKGDNRKYFFKERLWIGKGDIGIVCLWTAKERVVEKLDKEAMKRVAVIGQLYTKSGIEYIIKNCFRNPKIRYLIVWGEDLNGSGEMLAEARLEELEKSGGVIPREAIKEWLKVLKIIDMRGKRIEEVGEMMKKLEIKRVGGLVKREFKMTEARNEKRPSERSGFRVEAETIGEAWLEILDDILKFGVVVPRVCVYGGEEKVLLDVVSVITAEEINKPKIWRYFSFNKDDLRIYFKNFFKPKRGEEPYTYGERLFAYEIDGEVIDQVAVMAEKLRSFPYNKGALAVLWQAGIDNFGKRKPWRTPCLTLVQGFCLEDKLFLTAYFRSNDMFGAWSQNAFALRKLQTELAKKIGRETGDLTIISSTAFIDGNDLAAAERVVGENRKSKFNKDRRGYLTIETKEGRIICKHYDNEGGLIKEYREAGKEERTAMKMASKLVADKVISKIDHALDIGEQLGRAEDAVKLGLKFEQDKDLKNGVQ